MTTIETAIAKGFIKSALDAGFTEDETEQLCKKAGFEKVALLPLLLGIGSSLGGSILGSMGVRALAGRAAARVAGTAVGSKAPMLARGLAKFNDPNSWKGMALDGIGGTAGMAATSPISNKLMGMEQPSQPPPQQGPNQFPQHQF